MEIGSGMAATVYKQSPTRCVKKFQQKSKYLVEKQVFEQLATNQYLAKHLVKIFGACDRKKQLEMEYVPNVLEDMIVARRIPESRKNSLLAQLTNILKVFKDMGFIHGDFKAKNMLVTKDWRILIIDFDLSKFVSEDQFVPEDVKKFNYLRVQILLGMDYHQAVDYLDEL